LNGKAYLAADGKSRFGGGDLKVLSWFRSKSADNADPAPLADSWRLDDAVPPQRPRKASPPADNPKPQPRTEPPATVQEIRRLLERTAANPPAPSGAPSPARPAEPARAPAALRPAQPPRLPEPPRPSELLRAAEPRRAEPPRQAATPIPLREKRKPATSPSSARGLLAGFDLQKSYGGRRVVNGVNLNVSRGEAVGLLGPNGAGKTTVFYMVIGLVKADEGRIELDGYDVTKLPMYRRARLGIGYLPQEASIFRGLTVEDNILSVLEFVEPDRDKRMERLNALLDEFSLHKVRKSPSIALSGGERRRCEIARSLATNPSFMLLDEPFAGIDPIAVGDIQELVRLLTERGIGVLITDHNVRETLGLVDRAYIVHSGTILMEGSPEEIVESRDVRRLYLGEEFRL
jgi:lipopolysaccharide export system ATP-binding protein